MSSDKLPLSVVVIAKNEADNIVRCLTSVQWADELVVVDDHSTDETASRATALGARVLTHRFESFASQRNWALEEGELRHKWVLMLDADEAGTPEFAEALARHLREAGNEVVACRTCRKTMFLGRWLKRSDGFPVWIMRLVRRGAARFEDAGHGEVPVPAVNGPLGTIREPFVHYPFSKGLTDWVTRHLRYAEREARRELMQREPVRLTKLFSPRGEERRRALRNLGRLLPGRPMLRFFYQYVWKGGILEGQAGLIFSFLMALYEGLIVVKKVELTRLDRGESI